MTMLAYCLWTFLCWLLLVVMANISIKSKRFSKYGLDFLSAFLEKMYLAFSFLFSPILLPLAIFLCILFIVVFHLGEFQEKSLAIFNKRFFPEE